MTTLREWEGSMIDEIDAYNTRRLAERKRNMVLAGIGACLIITIGALLVGKFLSDTRSLGDMANQPPREAPQEVVIEALPPLERRAFDVRSEPEGASIILNGIATRLETPASVQIVRDAQNTLVFIKDGFETEVVTIDADASDLAVKLTPYEAPVLPANPNTAAQEPDVEPEPVHGRIRVISRSPGNVFEGAEVLWNGRPQAELTPLVLKVQPHEEQHLTVRHIDHLDGVMFVQAIPFRGPNDMRDALVELQKRRDNAFAALAIRTFPRDAKVYLDDEDITGSIVTPIAFNRHFMLRVESPGLETYERAFDAIVGSIDLSIMLKRPVYPDGTLSVDGAPEDATLYLISRREGDESATEIGRGNAPLRTMESGPYTLRVASGPYNRRTRNDFDIDIPANGHLSIKLGVRDDTLQVVDQNNRKPRNR